MTGGLPEVADVRSRAAEVAQRIEAAGGDLERVVVVAVTKAFGPELAQRAMEAGLRDLGENYAQELAAKAEVIQSVDGEGPRWHFIGGLQRNKVKLLASTVSLWHTIDRSSLVDEIAKRCPDTPILIQVNTTGEAQKSGCEPTEAEALVERARAAGLVVRGLMTVGPTSGEVDPRPGFEALRELAGRCEVSELSMGMSADYELAVAEGSTMVRVGSVLFGPRPSRGEPSPRSAGPGN